MLFNVCSLVQLVAVVACSSLCLCVSCCSLFVDRWRLSLEVVCRLLLVIVCCVLLAGVVCCCLFVCGLMRADCCLLVAVVLGIVVWCLSFAV